MDWLHSITAADIIGNAQKTTAELAIYFHVQIVKNFKEDPKHRFTVIESEANHKSPALQLELALIEIDPSASVFEARLRDKSRGYICRPRHAR